jgi:glycosyltransferase involved in cell wall biosynthesis
MKMSVHQNYSKHEVKKLRILMIAPSFPPHNQGGGGSFYKTLAHKLFERGHSITVITGYHGKELKKENLETRDGKIEIIWLPLMKIAQEKYPQMQESLPPNIQSFFQSKTINHKNYDLIHMLAFGHLLIDILNLVMRTQRKILTIHGFPKFIEKKDEGRADQLIKLSYRIYLNTLGKHTLNSARIITVPSSFVAEECIQQGISPSKVKTIPNGLDLQNYCPAQSCYELEKKYNIMKEDVLILSIARIVWLKGFEYAIDAIHQVVKQTERSIKYMIVGPIEDQKYYSKLVKQVEMLGLKNNVIFTGLLDIVSQKDQNLKLQALTRADIFLVTSLHESFGFVVLEAMAVGKPIVASNLEGIACILDNMKTGILVNPTISKEIADAVTTLLNNPILCKKLSDNANYEIKKYDWETIVDSYEKIYRQ